MKIKVVCERTGLTDRTIRYYIEEGLVSPSFRENYIGRKSFDFTEENVAELNDIAVLRSFDFSIEEIRQILKDPSGAPAIIEAVKDRVCGELTANQKKTSLLSSLQEQEPYTVSELAEHLSSAEIAPAKKGGSSRPWYKIGIAVTGILIFLGVGIFALAGTCEHRDADDNALCDMCEESFTDAVEHDIGFKTFDTNGTTVYGKVSSTTTKFSFLNEIGVLGNATFQVFRDSECRELIESKVPDLAFGDNIFYVLAHKGGGRDTLYAVTVRRKPMYTVTFDTAGGTVIAPQLIEEDGLIPALEDPQKTGNTFVSWSRDLTLPVTEDLTVQANWTLTPYTVTYDANGGTVGAPFVSVTYGQAYVLETPKRIGYFFGGWFCGENSIKLTGNWDVTEDITLTAKWIPKADTPYRVEHYTEKLDGTYELMDVESLKGTSDAEVTPDTRHYEGFTAPAKQTVTILPDGTRIIRYEYARSSYTVTFIANGGNRIAAQEMKRGDPLPDAERAGYTFGGWFSDVDLESAVTIVPMHNITVYAWWVEETKPGAFSYFGSKEITLTGYTADDVDVCIPDFIGGEPVTYIDDRAFIYCSTLRSITLPIFVSNISSSLFRSCQDIALITVKSGNSAYHSKGNCLIETATNTLILGCKNSVIPDYVTSIGRRAFSNCRSITSIALPAGLTSIGDYAFEYCLGLKSVELPANLTSIGDHAFYSCSALASITLSEGLTSIGNYAFYGCYELASITIPGGVSVIAKDAFNCCFSLASVTICEGVTSIETHAFYNCTSLTSITLPESLTHIGNAAFYNCTSLTSITLPESLTDIGEWAFANCTNLKKVSISRNTKIEATVFKESPAYIEWRE